MEKNKYYYKILPIFEKVFQKFLEKILPLSYKIYNIEEYQRIILIEDNLVIYFALEETDLNLKKENMYNFLNDITYLYKIHIEEMTANEIFKFNAKNFCDQFEPEINTYSFIKIIKFSSIAKESFIQETVTTFNYINSKLKQLKLEERQNFWRGWIYNFIIFQIKNFESNSTVCVWSSRQQNINKLAFLRCKYLEKICFSGYGINPYNKQKIEKNFVVDNNFSIIAKSIKNYAIKNKPPLNLYNKIQYTFTSKSIKHENDVDFISLDLISKYKNGQLNYLETFTYNEIPCKWKSEYLVKELCEKIFGKENVIYQYRPFFLASKNGQLSYDIFLPKKRIAIEYQGKQHFQPIIYFGGENAFVKQKERDFLKKQLSNLNHIKLIYINYTDPITEEFILQKINKS